MNIDSIDDLMLHTKNINKIKINEICLGDFEKLKEIKNICYIWNNEYQSKFRASSFAIFIKDNKNGNYKSITTNKDNEIFFNEKEIEVFKNSSIKFIDNFGKNSIFIIFLKSLKDYDKNLKPIKIYDVNGVLLKTINETLNNYDEAFNSLESLKIFKSNYYVDYNN